MQQFTDVRKSRSWFAHSLALHLQLLPPSPVSLLSKLSFSSVLLAFTLFLWEDHRLFLLRLQSSALQERRDRETSSSVSSLSFFPSVLSLGLRSGELRLWFSRVNDLWMRSAMRWSRGERLGLRCGSPVECEWVNMEVPWGNRGLRGCVCLCLKNASVCEYPEQKVVSEQTGCWCISFRQRCIDAH